MRIAIFLITMFTALRLSAANEIPERPDPPKFVNDFSGLLTETEAGKLERKLQRYSDSTSAEIVIVIQPSVDNEDIIAHSRNLFKEWGIGGLKNDNGVLITYSAEDKRIAIIAGYAMENYVTDAAAYRIRENYLKPTFRRKDFYGGLDEATSAIMLLINGQFETADLKSESHTSDISLIIFLVIFFVFFG